MRAKIVSLIVVPLLLAACGAPSESSIQTAIAQTANAPIQAAPETSGVASGPTATESFRKWTSQQVINAFLAMGLEADNPHLLTEEEMGAAPKLTKDIMRFLIPSLGADSGGRVFSFDSPKDLEITKTYYVELGKNSKLVFSWVYVRDNILVQINGSLAEAEAQKYEAALNSLSPQTAYTNPTAIVITPAMPTIAVTPSLTPTLADPAQVVYLGVGKDEKLGLQVEITRLAFGDRDKMLEYRLGPSGMAKSLDDDYWSPFETAGELIWRITNTSEMTISFYPSQGLLALESEQIQLSDAFLASSNFGDTVDGDLLPGTTLEGGILFGVKRSTMDTLAELKTVFFRSHVSNENDFGNIEITVTLR